MIIDSLHIYGFGKIKDLKVNLDQGINLIKGLNEAGKSTTMSFIRGVFFGFESRRNLHLRYEPLDGGQFGGAIELKDTKGELYRIERVFISKITGDVKVYLPNGEIKGEEYLPILLGKINEQVFKQIFSFGLTELQQLDTLQDEEINDFIYHAGTGSVSQILKIKEHTEQKQQQLFKSSGRKPEINLLLSELDANAKAIEQLRNKNDQHQSITSKINDLQKQITVLDNEIDERASRLAWLEKVNTYYKPYKRFKELEQSLANFPEELIFPDNGVERLNLLTEKIDELRLESKQLEGKKSDQLAEMSKLQQNPLYDANELLITGLKEDLNSYKELKKKYYSLMIELESIQFKLENNFNQLGSSFNEGNIVAIEFTLNDKQYVQELANNISSKEKEQADLDKTLELKENRQAQLNKALNNSLLENDNNDQNESNNFISGYNTIKENWQRFKEKEWQQNQLLEQSRFFEDQAKNKNKRKISSLIIGVIGLGMVASIALMFFGYLVYGGLTLFFTFISALLLYSKNGSADNDRLMKQNISKLKLQIDHLNDELEQIKHQSMDLTNRLGLSFTDFNEDTITELNKKYNYILENEQKNLHLKSKITEYKQELELLEIEIEHLKRKSELADITLNNLKSEWHEWLSSHNLDGKTSQIAVFDLMTTIQSTKELIKGRDIIRKESSRVQLEIEKYEQKAKELKKTINLELIESVEEIVNQLYDNLKKNQRLTIELEHISKSIEQIDEQIITVEAKLELEQGKLNELLQFAKTSDAEQFYLKAKQYEEYSNLIAEKKQLVATIKSSCSSDSEYNRLLDDLLVEESKLVAEIAELSSSLRVANTEIKELSEEKGQLQNQIKQMEEDYTLSELNQQYASNQAELKRKAKEYLANSIAREILDKTMKVYEIEKQPKVIQLASEYFKIMSNGSYKRIIKSIDTQDIEVIRKDDVRLKPQYLSRGTIEQLFLAMRFAIIDEFSKQANLPIVLDDILVNFDGVRLERTLDVIEEMANRHQILIFTCHNHISESLIKKVKSINHINLSKESDLTLVK